MASARKEYFLRPGYTLSGKKIEQCTQPSGIHWPIVVPASRLIVPGILQFQYRFSDKGLPVQQCTEPN
ncbi:unnamed protein product [Porites lobata]|uniref:Uncharacterized protein n=1 Tax=Porites lobata TaxID=104759 RepID=A0ABN8QT43_9CNID|nr:unnamed protein product [Porites lobata]